MMKKLAMTGFCMFFVMLASVTFAAYHHMGENDSKNFLEVYPDKAGTKLDHCALCHKGGEYEKKPGMFISLGSCQWCHLSYGYDGSGNIIDTINSYGMNYLTNGRNAAAIRLIEGEDSDQDGHTNKAEIDADRFPGDNADDPQKKTAVYKIYTRAELEALGAHKQFLLMNTSRSGDFYAEYTGVPVEDLLKDAGILDSATGITVFAPDGWSTYHPLDKVEDPELYHVNGIYPQAAFHKADDSDQWCDYDAPSCTGRSDGNPINVANGLKMILAFTRDGADLTAGILNSENKLDGEGPFRVVVPQKNATEPDQSSRSDNQNVTWPYNYDWDHNAGACSRSATIIRVEPLPEGTTDINTLEAGWSYVGEEKIIIYGAISGNSEIPDDQTPYIDGETPDNNNQLPNDTDDDSDNCFIQTIFRK